MVLGSTDRMSVEHDEIGAFAGLEAPRGLVLLHGVGGIDRVGVDRRRQRNALIDIQRCLPRAAGSRDAGLKGPKRIIGGDVPVAAADDGRTRTMEAARRIEKAITVGPEIRL